MDIKQVIVIRKDLKMRRGKECAQAAHASMAFLTKKLIPFTLPYETVGTDTFLLGLTFIQKDWLDSSFRKIVVKVNSEDELTEIYNKAKQAGLVAHLICDRGLTEFKEPTYTCCAIGPDLDEKIDKITGSLELY